MKEHNHDNCCGHDHDFEHDSITLSLDDGTELNCMVLDVFTVEGNCYIALQSIDDEDEYDNVLLYRYQEDGDNEPHLINIEDDNEFDAVADAFEEMIDNMEFDDMFEDDVDFDVMDMNDEDE